MATPYPGMDPEYLKSLQAMIAAMGPSVADKDAAKYQGLLAMGLGLMGARKGQEFAAAGNAGLLGLDARNRSLAQATAEKGAGLNQAVNAQQLQATMRSQADADQYRAVMKKIAEQDAGGQTEPFGAQGGAPIVASFGPAIAPAAGGARLSTNKMTDFDKAVQYAKRLQAEGVAQQYVDAAWTRAEKLRPEYSQAPQIGRDANGQLYQFVLDKSGNEKRLTAGVKPDVQLENLGGTVQAIDKNAAHNGQSWTRTATPDAIISDDRARELAALKRQELQGGDQPMSPEAIANAAARYNIDGTLPPMGMGKVAGTYRSAILNEAARQAAGVSPADQRMAQIDNKAASAAVNKVAQNEAVVGAYERTFNKNLDIVKEYSGKVDRTGVPVINKWLNAGKRAVAGDPQLAAYDGALKSVANEYAKIVSGSMGNQAMAEGEIKKVENLLNAAQTPEQVNEVVAFMQRETQNRMAGFKEQRAALRAGITGKPAESAHAVKAESSVPLVKNSTETFRAKEAIKRGADPGAVKQRMIERGIDPGGL